VAIASRNRLGTAYGLVHRILGKGNASGRERSAGIHASRESGKLIYVPQDSGARLVFYPWSASAVGTSVRRGNAAPTSPAIFKPAATTGFPKGVDELIRHEGVLSKLKPDRRMPPSSFRIRQVRTLGIGAAF